MARNLTVEDFDELWEECQQDSAYNPVVEPFEYFCETPKKLGKGYYRKIEVYPQLWLSIFDKEYHHDVLFHVPVSDHPLQFSVLVLGAYTSTYGQVGGEYTLISGGGVQREFDAFYPQSQRFLGIDIEMPPQLLATLFPGKDGDMLPNLKFLAQENDWQTLLFPKTSAAMQVVVQQIINCPYQGTAKRMYLQGKVIELMALQLAPFLEDNTQACNATQRQLSPRLKKQTVAKIYHAKEILQARLENPPLLSELAQQVNVSESSLQRGFQTLFGTTVFGYLTSLRIQKKYHKKNP